MYIILLRFSNNRDNAAQHLAEHKTWLASGFEEGLFLLAGTLGSNSGGGILAHGVPLSKIEDKVNDDPFVRENVVSAEILEFAPAKASDEFQHLLDKESKQ